MKGLPSTTVNNITSTRGINLATYDFVLTKFKASTLAKPPANNMVAPIITSHKDAQANANHHNLTSQLVIGANEDAAKSMTEMICSNATNSVL